jgi:hypothetical protein
VRTDADIPNAAPTAELGGPYPGRERWMNEGALFALLDGSRSADPNGDPLTYTWTLDNVGGGVTATGVRPALRIPDDGPGASRVVVRLTVRDPAGLTGTATTTVRVDNYRPWFTTSDVTLPAGVRTYTRLLTFYDPGRLDAPWTTAVQWGDGTSASLTTTAVDAEGDGRVLLTHTYPGPGTYAVVLTITDKDGGRRTRTFTVQVQA